MKPAAASASKANVKARPPMIVGVESSAIVRRFSPSWRSTRSYYAELNREKKEKRRIGGNTAPSPTTSQAKLHRKAVQRAYAGRGQYRRRDREGRGKGPALEGDDPRDKSVSIATRRATGSLARSPAVLTAFALPLRAVRELLFSIANRISGRHPQALRPEALTERRITPRHGWRSVPRAVGSQTLWYRGPASLDEFAQLVLWSRGPPPANTCP